MIGERHELCDHDPARLEREGERRGGGDAGEGQDARARELGEVHRPHSARLPALGRDCQRGEHGDARRDALDRLDDGRRLPKGRRPGGHDQAGARERGERLAQGPGGQEPAVAPRVRRARHDDLEVLRQRPVLERVVEHDRAHAEALDGALRRLVAVAADEDRHAGQPTREKERLVAGLLRVQPDGRRVGDDLDAAAPPAVAAAHDGGTVAEDRERLHGDLDRRRLARATDGQVADRDHGTADRARLQHAAPVEPLPRAEKPAVAPARRRQEAPRPASEALLPAAREP